jgi:hypothetical protein
MTSRTHTCRQRACILPPVHNHAFCLRAITMHSAFRRDDVTHAHRLKSLQPNCTIQMQTCFKSLTQCWQKGHHTQWSILRGDLLRPHSSKMVRCAFSDRILHSRMPLVHSRMLLVSTHVRLKRCRACGQQHASRESAALTVTIIHYVETV